MGRRTAPSSFSASVSVSRAALAAATLLVAICLQPGVALHAEGTEAKPVARQEPPLPRLEAPLLGGGGQNGSTDVFRKRRGLLFVFASTDPSAVAFTQIVRRIEVDAAKANIALLGVNRDESAETGARFVKEQKLGFAILQDAEYAVSLKLGMRRGQSAAFVVDGEGYVILPVVAAPGQDFDPELIEKILRESLYLPTKGLAGQENTLGVTPPAPSFSVKGMNDSEPGASLDAFKGDVVLVVFFLHTCPHCHEGLKFLGRLQSDLKRKDLHVVPISLRPMPDAVAQMKANLKIDYPLYLDPTEKARRDYAAGTQVPEFFLLDRQHRVIAHHSGMDGRVEALLSMEVRKALGVDTPILLSRGGYSGEQACRICHASQHDTWSLTSHAYAFETLVEHGADRKAECLQCHTVGFGEKGGFDPAARQEYLLGVQCENCHGRGGPHQSPEFAKAGYESACAACHNSTHSLNFSFAERLSLISHASNQQFAKLSVEERRKLLERRGKRERPLFQEATHVGSERCAQCHPAEFERWKTSPHATAFGTLEKAKKSSDAKCQSCHTTGFGKPGGFAAASSSKALQGVGCESCHGPGGDHVVENADRSKTILSLTDKCDSCVVLQICGSCHDDANDPGFEFEVVDKIDRLRHGFRDREAPKPPSAQTPAPAKGSGAE